MTETQETVSDQDQTLLDKIVKYLPITITVFSLLGVIDTIFLLNLHASQGGSCPIDNGSFLGRPIDCGGIAKSSYSELLGIPIALFGFLYYLSIFILISYEPQISKLLKNKTQIEWLTPFNIGLAFVSFAMLVSIYLFFVQMSVLKLVCTYCMGSVLTTLLLTTSYYLIFLNNRQSQ